MSNPKRKIMYLNPVGTPLYDQVFADMAAQYKLPDTEVHVTSLAESEGAFTHIEFRSYEAMVTAGIIKATRAAAREGFDALAIGCFYDTALHDAREVSGDMIVTAPCLASCRLASNLCNRFGVIVGRQKWVDQMSSTVKHHGYSNACAGFFHVGLGVNEFQADHARTNNLLTQAAETAIEQAYAEAIILGCTLEIGFHERLEKKLGVPVIDVSIAAMKDAEYAAEMKKACNWTPSRKWSCEAPCEEEMAKIGVFDQGYIFGNRIVVKAN
ncbi:MAG: aspartate/glutamate racemase family protein [Marinovum sp.]|nr:aspartate/glutamate racemase family protein [Marinovum sp.]